MRAQRSEAQRLLELNSLEKSGAFWNEALHHSVVWWYLVTRGRVKEQRTTTNSIWITLSDFHESNAPLRIGSELDEIYLSKQRMTTYERGLNPSAGGRVEADSYYAASK